MKSQYKNNILDCTREIRERAKKADSRIQQTCFDHDPSSILRIRFRIRIPNYFFEINARMLFLRAKKRTAGNIITRTFFLSAIILLRKGGDNCSGISARYPFYDAREGLKAGKEPLTSPLVVMKGQ